MLTPALFHYSSYLTFLGVLIHFTRAVKDAFDVELPTGKVHKENVDKAFEFRFSDACAAIRSLTGVSDTEKESVLMEAKIQKLKLQKVVYDILASNNIEIME